MSEVVQAILGAVIGGLIFAAIVAFDLFVFLPWVFRKGGEE